eukprot:gnl/Dysnectes_brevis/8280_a14595_201.p1 GENE.gnl/Dysnectes_brevis/8280_a14595_201~~gnl/Dysnectes_brevis/8280_a14595_201.p1  ORF type:complete len:235 (+),score=41.79 gnl/Dysnectes_brevis/8280_a14595_201:132-836(+)
MHVHTQQIKKPSIMFKKKAGPIGFAKFFPKDMVALFEPLKIEFKPPAKVKTRHESFGLASTLSYLQSDTCKIPQTSPRTPPVSRKVRKKEATRLRIEHEKDRLLEQNDPKKLPNPSRTVILSNLPYLITRVKVRRMMGDAGRVSAIRIVTDADFNPRGYAFVEFESERSVEHAMRMCPMDRGRRVRVDRVRCGVDSAFLPNRVKEGTSKCEKTKPSAQQAPRRGRHSSRPMRKR